MDAIPSLCASSASCAAASLGYAFTQSRSTNHDRSPVPQLSSSSRRSLSTNSSTQPHQSAGGLPRKRPASSPQPPDIFKRSSTLSGLEEEGEGETFIHRHSSRPQTGRASEDIPKRSSWYRRISTVAPSTDGSLDTPSYQYTNTPSVFSNGSSATPLFGQQIIPVTTRNKLVKRSTSYKGLHSQPPADSLFALNGKGPTFRRPATSHQRSDLLRQRSARQIFSSVDNSPDLDNHPWQRKRNRASIAEEIEAGNPSLQPFFRYQQKKIAREPGSRKSSTSKFFGNADYITSVVSTVGENATLVLGSLVERPKMDSIRPADPLMEEMFQADRVVEQKEDQSLPLKKSRHSSGTAPTSTTPWKLTRGSSLSGGKGQKKHESERRVVSAPQRVPRTIPITQATSSATSNRRLSPLPRLETLSAFEIDMHPTEHPNRNSLGADGAFTAQEHDGAGYNTSSSLSRGQTSFRLKSHSRRTSRVPSDRSTILDSDNENSRVFSVDGDDMDHRSETIYDSIRTEASGSSHSGARNHRAENVFGDCSDSELVKSDLSTLEEKLSGISFQDDHNVMAEEEDSMRTPVWRRKSDEDEMTTPQAKRHDLSQGLFSKEVDKEVLHGAAISPPLQLRFQDLNNDIDMSDNESIWDDEFGGDTSVRVSHDLLSPEDQSANNFTDGSENSGKAVSNIFEWSEPAPIDRAHAGYSPNRPKTSHPQQGIDRGSRPAGRRPTNGLHLRSQSVPLPPDASKHKFNNAKKLDNWMLGNKGVSEDWDNDFEFEELAASDVPDTTAPEGITHPRSGIVVPKDILERQATVHGQFGQVRELTLLVEQLRRLYHSATVHRLMEGQSSELWKEAAGIIDLATLDEEDTEIARPASPSTGFDFDPFDDESPSASRRRSSVARSTREGTPSGQMSSPSDSRLGTPKSRPRNDSVARAKNVLANIHQQRDPLDPPLEVEEGEEPSPSKAKKMPFDTTSLRDLVTRAGVVTRACKEIIRKLEDPDYIPHTPERRPITPPDPPFFSQIFQQSPAPSTPSSDRRSSRAAERVLYSTPTTDSEIHGHNVSMMTAV